MITLTGLTPRQVRICEKLWNFDSMEKVNAFVVLGGAEVRAMRDLMTAEVLDQHQDVAQEVVDYINRFRL